MREQLTVRGCSGSVRRSQLLVISPRGDKAAVHAVQSPRPAGSRRTAQPAILFGLLRQIAPPPVFLHAGFKAAGPADVRTLMDRMEADGITIVERDDEPAYTAFKCLDPDGHRIEVYWEPPFSR
jgi:catechol 2,3-dioxygenase-like lactoylglutathione lyase family enzyme